MRILHTNVRKAGFSLIEVLIGCVVLALLVGSMGVVVLSSRGVYEEGLKAASLESRARRTVQRLATELTAAEALPLAAQATAPLGASTLNYHTCDGFAGGVKLWSTPSRIELRPDPNDANDGVDNDGDGSIDEQQVVLVRDVGLAEQTESVICGGVRELLQGEISNMADDNGNGLTDERGLSFVTDGNNTLTIRLTLESRDARGVLATRTVETAVHVRN